MTVSAALARRLGVATSYVNQTGRRCEPPAATVAALVRTLEAAEDATERMVDVVAVVAAGENAPSVNVRLSGVAESSRISWRVEFEPGGIVAGERLWSTLSVAPHGPDGGEQRLLPLPTNLSPGYHRLTVAADVDPPRSAEARLIVSPPRAHVPPERGDGGRWWGISVQLYALRSPRNWGIGDFTDLRRFAVLAARYGADAVGINPIHALFLDEPERASPYSPSSRLHFNPLYLDIEAIPEFAECRGARARVAEDAFRRRLDELRAAPLVDYTGVAALKLEVLPLLHDEFCRRRAADSGDALGRDFERFRRRRGAVLRRFAVFEALREMLSARDAAMRAWHRWPAEYRDPTSEATAAFAAEHAGRVEFFEYLQWHCNTQLEDAHAAARAAGMALGLYRDLAIGADAAGADAWSDPTLALGGWEIGAPPDSYNTQGQRWGVPPPNPVGLRDRAYEPFIAMLRANIEHAGAIRIDHVLGLARLFVVPNNVPPSDGTYLRFPLEDLLGTIRLESQRHSCLVIGEDLGTLPDGLQAALDASGLFSYRLFMFERDADGSFRGADAYPPRALVAFSTHDLPTLPGYWSGEDIALKHGLGLIAGDEEVRRWRTERERDKRQIGERLGASGLAPDLADEAPPVLEIYRFLARTPARLLMVHVEDALDVRAPINVPGTIAEHPNWRRKLPSDSERLFADPRVIALLRAVSEERHGPPRD